MLVPTRTNIPIVNLYLSRSLFLRSLLILVIISMNSVIAAPVTIDSSAIGSSLSDRNTVGITVSSTTRPYIGIGTQNALLPYFGFSAGKFHISGLTPCYTFVNSEAYSIDLLATPRFLGYSPEDSETLQGLDAKHYSIHGGFSFSFSAIKLQFNTQLLTDLLNESNGTELIASIGRSFSLSNVTVSPSIGISWQDSALVDHYYGVQDINATEALSAYSADSVVNTSLSLTAGYPISDSISTAVTLLWERYGNAISNSPLVESASSTAVSVGILYSF